MQQELTPDRMTTEELLEWSRLLREIEGGQRNPHPSVFRRSAAKWLTLSQEKNLLLRLIKKYDMPLHDIFGSPDIPHTLKVIQSTIRDLRMKEVLSE